RKLREAIGGVSKGDEERVGRHEPREGRLAFGGGDELVSENRDDRVGERVGGTDRGGEAAKVSALRILDRDAEVERSALIVDVDGDRIDAIEDPRAGERVLGIVPDEVIAFERRHLAGVRPGRWKPERAPDLIDRRGRASEIEAQSGRLAVARKRPTFETREIALDGAFPPRDDDAGEE